MSLALSVDEFRRRALSGARAAASDRFLRTLGSIGLAQVVVRVSRLASTVILSRALDPESFGLAAIVLTVYELVALFTRNGVSAKVVQASPDTVERVAQTAYWMTWAICLALMALQLSLALPVAWIYHDSRIAAPIAIMALIYLATPLSNIQGAFIQRDGRVSRIALAGAVQVTTDNALTAAFALGGFGMWAILWPKILVAPIWVLFLRYGHSWRPKAFSGFAAAFEGWRDIARFSRSVMGVELLTTLQANVDNLLVGYFLGVAALGIYAFAFNAGLGITLGLVTAFGTAVYPHLCELRADPAALSDRFRRTRKTVALITTPIILLQTFSAPIYVPLVFGQKWEVAVPTLMVICLSALARPYASMASQLLKAVGRPEIEFRWQIVTTTLLVVALAVAAQFGVFEVGLAVLAVQTTMASAFALLAPRNVLARAAVVSEDPKEDRDPSYSPVGPRRVETPHSASMQRRFFLIGAAKSGTTVLHKWLQSQSGVYLPDVKEPHHFCFQGLDPSRVGRGVDPHYVRTLAYRVEEYDALYVGALPGQALGDASPGYLHFSVSAEAIAARFPQAKIVCLLRNPADRAFSQYMHHVRDGLESEPTFEGALAKEPVRATDGWWWGFEYRSAGFYFDRLSRFYAIFGAGNVLVETYDDLQSDPRGLVNRVLAFLDCPPAETLDLAARPNVASSLKTVPRFPILHRALTAGGPLHSAARAVAPSHFTKTMKAAIFALNNSAPAPRFNVRTRRALLNDYRDDVLLTSKLVGKDLSSWLA